MNGAAVALSMAVTGGLIALAAALAVATVLGVVLRRRAGLGPDGAIARRAVGLPRKADVIAALGSVIPEPPVPHGSTE
jgi:hypothetical protein